VPIETDQSIALGYAPNKVRHAFTTLLRLDARFAHIVAQARDLTLGQIKLQWWYDAIMAAGTAQTPNEPLLNDIATIVQDHDVSFKRIAGLTRGWSALLEPLPFDEERLRTYAQARGAELFTIAAVITDAAPGDNHSAAGQGWALADFAFRCSDPATAALAVSLAKQHFSTRPERRCGGAMRTFAILAHFGAIDVKSGVLQPRPDTPRRRAFEAIRFSTFL
jgi:15-cis-phytoene synthase